MRDDRARLVAANVTLVSKTEEDAASAHIRTLAADHWLHSYPLDPRPLLDEFGWEATPLADAVKHYMAWLRAVGNGS